MKGTRLWQAPGSPIIQGRSRTARPFWEVWLSAALWAEGIVAVVGVLLAFRVPGATLASAARTMVMSLLLPALPGCAVGAAIGVWIARSMGWRRAWLAGALLGAAVAGITVMVI